MRDSEISRNPSDCKVELSPDQEAAIKLLTERLFNDNKRYVHLDGPAGSGKTTITTGLVNTYPDLDIVFCAPTGKAASVQMRRGVEAYTVHGLIYGQPIGTKKDQQGREQLTWMRRGGDKLDAELVVADECSMLNPEVSRDLIRSCREASAKLLVTGDHAQLLPVSGSVFFDRPDFQLTKIHRQALGSQPLRLATEIREHRFFPTPVRFNLDRCIDADIVLTAFERTRQDINKRIRRALGRPDGDPVVGDPVCCYRTNHATNIFNGTIWTVVEAGFFTDKSGQYGDERDMVALELVDDLGTEAEAMVPARLFWGADPRKMPFDPDYHFDVFSFGFALTVHKAQGSEWDTVVVIDETRNPGFDYIIGDRDPTAFKRSWLYTACSRARLKVVVMEEPR